jgi:hypothetical protein
LRSCSSWLRPRGLLGVGLLLLTDPSLNFINLAAFLVDTFTVPCAAIQLALYFDLEARTATGPPAPGARAPSAGCRGP